mmetsp:Transcript_19214/g.32747  ORF Transcript_19214/g.32747 Transcript_19214/m.32747 type:complete len:91 (+) Transcript_19214:345-617(+)
MPINPKEIDEDVVSVDKEIQPEEAEEPAHGQHADIVKAEPVENNNASGEEDPAVTSKPDEEINGVVEASEQLKEEAEVGPVETEPVAELL